MSDSVGEGNPPQLKYVGLALAVGSGVFIGSSFVFKKKGLLAAQRKYETRPGESFAYLKNAMWWTGMTIMVLGEVLNFVAYAFADAVLVTPMGALSVVVCAVLSSIFLKEKLTLFGKIGCFLCVVGSVIIAINAPEQKIGGDIRRYEHFFIAPGFLTWVGICIVASLILVFVVAPKYGKRSMLVYIAVCSLIGGLSVSVTSGLGSAVVLSIRGHNQFTYWFTYFLFAFIVVTLIVEIVYLNKALELFNTAAVTPTYYVLFTAATIITSVILSQGLQAPPVAIVTVVFGFFTICAGIALLQLSKMDAQELKSQPGLDRKSSVLLRAAQLEERNGEPEEDPETAISQIEDPGMDTIRGGLGVVGSIMRARSSRRQSSRRRPVADDSSSGVPLTTNIDSSVPRYELYDRPMSFSPEATSPQEDNNRQRKASVKFAADATEPHDHHATSPRKAGSTSNPRSPLRKRDSPLISILESQPEGAKRASSPTLAVEQDDDSSTKRRLSGLGLTDGVNVLGEFDADVGDMSAAEHAPTYEEVYPPIWDDYDDALDADNVAVASPTGIVEHYYVIDGDNKFVHRASSTRRPSVRPRGAPEPGGEVRRPTRTLSRPRDWSGQFFGRLRSIGGGSAEPAHPANSARGKEQEQQELLSPR